MNITKLPESNDEDNVVQEKDTPFDSILYLGTHPKAPPAMPEELSYHID